MAISNNFFIITCCILLTKLDMSSGIFSCANPTPAIKPNDPVLPSLPSQSYQAHIQVNVLDKKYTTELDEYLDHNGKRAMMKITSDGQTSSRIYSFGTDEVFYINDQSCQVKNLTTNNDGFLFGHSKLDDDVFGLAGALRYAQDVKTYYQGQTDVRGIPANKWSVCIKSDDAVGFILVTYYFSTNDWSSASIGQNNPIPVPLRISAEGDLSPVPEKAGQGQTTSTRHFHHVSDIINYFPDIQADPTIFETPTDVICKGRKKTKPVPTFSRKFRYRAEEVHPGKDMVSHYALWYDGDVSLVREDRTYQTLTAPVYTLNPVTEIHDFSTGVRYIRDNNFGNCSVWPISLDEDDLLPASNASNLNQSLVIGMKDPHKLFNINDNYTFIGQKTVRGILCDVYSVDFPHHHFGKLEADSSFHYFFMAEEWTDTSDSGRTVAGKRFPVRLEIRSPKLFLITMYNFFDFDDQHSIWDAFDVSDCFDTKNKLDMRITFPGTYHPYTEKNWMKSFYYGLANVMGIPPIRISKPSIQHNSKNVFVKVTILGTANAAEFQLISHTSLEHENDKTFQTVVSSQDCANLCINNKDFVCRSFDFCPDNNNACHLSRYYIQTKMLLKPTTCDRYSRTITDTKVKEPSLSEAYDALMTAIAKKTFSLMIEDEGGFEAFFGALEVEILSGFLGTEKPLPSLPSMYSHRFETVVPSLKRAMDAYIWYDSVYNLVRLDNRNLIDYPYYETSVIHDFNSGISYTINKVTGVCTVSPIPNKGVFDVKSSQSKTNKDAGLVLKMKSPLELLYLDSTYQYIGQKTVRGIKCNAFQSSRRDFHITIYNRTVENTIFTFYFQTDDWSYYTADSLDTTRSQPVQLVIEDTEVEQVMIYNFFDFNDEHHSMDHFDISPCFGPEEKKSFVITFKDQPYHPVLDLAKPSFINDAMNKLADSANISPIRFQKASLSYDELNVYFLVTVMGSVSPSVLFRPIQKVTITKPVTIANIGSVNDCALVCLQRSSVKCLGFEYCPNQHPPACQLEASHDFNPANVKLNQTGECMQYSLTTKILSSMTSIDTIYRYITRDIYFGKIMIPSSTPTGLTRTYTPTSIRDGVYRSGGATSDAGSLLQKFHHIKSSKLNDAMIQESHVGLGIGDCALKCLQESTFHCQAFEFNFDSGTCRFATQHPDEMKSPLEVAASDTNVYSLLYTSEYQKMADSVMSLGATKTVSDVDSVELCARSCDEETDFRCESFDFCSDSNTCNLKKTNTLAPISQSTLMNSMGSCLHYSRNYIFDFVEHPHKILNGHDDVVISVGNASQCAVLCATGELQGCASFELCHVQQGLTRCQLSRADPNVNKNLTISPHLQCSLYTAANTKSAKSGSTCHQDVSGSTSVTSETLETGSGILITRTNMPDTSSTTYPKKSTTTAFDCSKDHSKGIKGEGDGSDTGAKVGIAFGTLFLGIIIGSLVMFVYFKKKERKGEQVDSHPLSPWSS